MLWQLKMAGSAGLFLAFGLFAGCGGKPTKVTGKVIFGGKPVVWGSVTLLHENGQYYQGPIGLDGTYTVENVPTGSVKIAVYSPKPYQDNQNPEKGGREREKATVRGGPTSLSGRGGGAAVEDARAKFKQTSTTPAQPKPPPEQWFPLPDHFADPNTSGLTGTVKSDQLLDIDLK